MTCYGMRISDWSSYVGSSELKAVRSTFGISCCRLLKVTLARPFSWRYYVAKISRKWSIICDDICNEGAHHERQAADRLRQGIDRRPGFDEPTRRADRKSTRLTSSH